METPSAYLADVLDQLRKLKRMGDASISQINEEQFFWKPDGESNSIALIAKHIAGNMLSRWRDFLTTDGEKPDRRRDAEFEVEGPDTRSNVLKRWEEGWELTLETIGSLKEADLSKIVYIRGEPHSVLQAVNRQLVHYATHVGQILFLAKYLAGESWKTLSIPRGHSGDYDVNKGGGVYKTK